VVEIIGAYALNNDPAEIGLILLFEIPSGNRYAKSVKLKVEKESSWM
jgi:hypothetical protein